MDSAHRSVALVENPPGSPGHSICRRILTTLLIFRFRYLKAEAEAPGVSDGKPPWGWFGLENFPADSPRGERWEAILGVVRS